MGVFAEWQPRYAEAGIATFPVKDKRPAVNGYLKVRDRLSSQYAIKFPDANQFGFACAQSGIAILDVDTPDEQIFADALAEFGPTPILVRSGSGNHQAWYRHSGETRKVRPDAERPIDILGGGMVVAPPSHSAKGGYTFIQGGLKDIQSLKPMRHPAKVDIPNPMPLKGGNRVGRGNRNNTLWRECMKLASKLGSVEDLMMEACRMNASIFYEPLPDEEVLRVVASAWTKELSGENWFGRGQRLTIAHDEVDNLLQNDPDAFILLTILKRHHWNRGFVAANAMAALMPGGGWPRKRFAEARNRLEQSGAIRVTRKRGPNRPAEYEFGVVKNDHQ